MSDLNPPLPQQHIQPGWPKAIGIINIILGVLGVIMGIFGFFALKLSKMMFKFAASADPSISSSEDFENLNAVLDKWVWTGYVSGSLVAIACLILLISGIQLLKRKKTCRTMILLHIVVMFIYLVFGAYILWGTNATQEQTEASAFINPGINASEMQAKVSKVTGTIGVLFYSIYPIFLLIWIFFRNQSKQHIDTCFT